MLTSSMPLVTAALSSALPPGAIKQLTQAIGNCSQPLTHRGPINAQAPVAYTMNAAGPGAMGPGTWNPADYGNILPQTQQSGNTDLPGFSPGTWNVTNYGGGSFYFPTNQQFNENSYYGGPTFNVGGSSVFQNTYANNSYVTNLTVDTVNGQPAPGKPGQIGNTGPSGAPGSPGAAGINGVNGFGEDGVDGFGFNGRNGLPGAPGANGRDAVLRAIHFRPLTMPIRYVTGARFDPVRCKVHCDTHVSHFCVGGEIVLLG